MALSGAHSIGGANLPNSGHDGRFNVEENKFGNTWHKKLYENKWLEERTKEGQKQFFDLEEPPVNATLGRDGIVRRNK